MQQPQPVPLPVITNQQQTPSSNNNNAFAGGVTSLTSHPSDTATSRRASASVNNNSFQRPPTQEQMAAMMMMANNNNNTNTVFSASTTSQQHQMMNNSVMARSITSQQYNASYTTAPPQQQQQQQQLSVPPRRVSQNQQQQKIPNHHHQNHSPSPQPHNHHGGGGSNTVSPTNNVMHYNNSNNNNNNNIYGRSTTNAAFGASMTSSPPLPEASSNQTRSPQIIHEEIHALRRIAKGGKQILPPVLSLAMTCLQQHQLEQERINSGMNSNNKNGDGGGLSPTIALRDNSLSPGASPNNNNHNDASAGGGGGSVAVTPSPNSRNPLEKFGAVPDFENGGNHQLMNNNNNNQDSGTRAGSPNNNKNDDDVVENTSDNKDNNNNNTTSSGNNNNSNNNVVPAVNANKVGNNNNEGNNSSGLEPQKGQKPQGAGFSTTNTPPLSFFQNKNSSITSPPVTTPKSVSPQALKALMMRRRSSNADSPNYNQSNNNNVAGGAGGIGENNAARATSTQRPRTNSRVEPNAPLIHLEVGNENGGGNGGAGGNGGMSTSNANAAGVMSGNPGGARRDMSTSTVSGLSIPASLFRRLPGGWIADASLAPLINSFSNEDILSMSSSDNTIFSNNNSFAAIAQASMASRPDSPLQPSKQYQVLKTLGKGSFSRVYLVRDVSNNQLFVNKIMKWEGAENEPPSEAENRHRLAKRDVNLISNCAHANIVQYIDSYETNKATHLIVEYVEGGDLSREIERRRTIGRLLRIEVALRFWVQIALALDYLHRNDIVHRDVKPANIMICKGSDGFVKLSDFGFAARSFEERGEQFGTPFYAAPEMWFPVDHSTKSDVWSAGVLLYELLSLRLPFPNNNTTAHAATKTKCSFPSLPPAVPIDLQNAVREMLKFEPTERPTLREVLSSNALLRAALKDLFEAVKATPTLTDAMREVSLSHIADILGIVIEKPPKTNNNNNRSTTTTPQQDNNTNLVPRAIKHNPNVNNNNNNNNTVGAVAAPASNNNNTNNNNSPVAPTTTDQTKNSSITSHPASGGGGRNPFQSTLTPQQDHAARGLFAQQQQQQYLVDQQQHRSSKSEQHQQQ